MKSHPHQSVRVFNCYGSCAVIHDQHIQFFLAPQLFLSDQQMLLTCILVGWIIKPKWIEEEMVYGGHSFLRRRLYSFMIRYAAPVIMAVLFLQSTGIWQ